VSPHGNRFTVIYIDTDFQNTIFQINMTCQTILDMNRNPDMKDGTYEPGKYHKSYVRMTTTLYNQYIKSTAVIEQIFVLWNVLF